MIEISCIDTMSELLDRYNLYLLISKIILLYHSDFFFILYYKIILKKYIIETHLLT